jgi:hypothetical protein
MFGCRRRIGCLVILVAVVLAAWYWRGSWYPKVRARLHLPRSAPALATARWEPLTPAGAARARVAYDRLHEQNGPVYVNVAPADIAALALDSVVRRLSPSATNLEAMARDDRLYLRAQVSVADLGGATILGPLATMLEGTQELTIGGRLEVLKPGHAQFHVQDIHVKELSLPAAIIPKLLERLNARAGDTTIAPDAIPVGVPRELADVRVGKGRVTLYKSVP